MVEIIFLDDVAEVVKLCWSDGRQHYVSNSDVGHFIIILMCSIVYNINITLIDLYLT